jgi:hypothetical protein
MIQVNEEAMRDYETRRYAELVIMATSVRGLGHYSKMVGRRVPMNLMRAALNAAIDTGVVDLDWTMARNKWGNLMRHPRMTSERRAMYLAMRRTGHSYPEIASAFGARHGSIVQILGVEGVELTREMGGRKGKCVEMKMIRVLKPKTDQPAKTAAYQRPLTNRTRETGNMRAAKLTRGEVEEIRRVHKAKGASMRTLAKQYSMSVAAIHAAIHGKSWATKGKASK